MKLQKKYGVERSVGQVFNLSAWASCKLALRQISYSSLIPTTFYSLFSKTELP
jgi:hypothetical protein